MIVNVNSLLDESTKCSGMSCRCRWSCLKSGWREMIDKVFRGRTLTFVFYDGRMDKKGSLENPPFFVVIGNSLVRCRIHWIFPGILFSYALVGSISCRGVEWDSASRCWPQFPPTLMQPFLRPPLWRNDLKCTNKTETWRGDFEICLSVWGLIGFSCCLPNHRKDD